MGVEDFGRTVEGKEEFQSQNNKDQSENNIISLAKGQSSKLNQSDKLEEPVSAKGQTIKSTSKAIEKDKELITKIEGENSGATTLLDLKNVED